jgi:hypothetical protein
LAKLGLGRAYVLTGDTAKARAAYQDFLALWKDADPDLPIFKEAKSEYESFTTVSLKFHHLSFQRFASGTAFLVNKLSRPCHFLSRRTSLTRYQATV